ncbi:MAG: alkaline phosphatase [Verrucomicrobiota bacterium JB022]|nr:alkaline phosphatase [Verrucomicrobiota bacterium JB022]
MKSPSPLSRRRFLQTTGLGGLLLGATKLGAANPLKPAKATGRPRNLIFLVSDGMTQGVRSAADTWLNLTENRSSEWTRLYQDGLARRALVETHSASSIVTDSAAASSAWGCGQRVPNRSINFSAEGKELTPLYSFARHAGKRVGLVSTARITHATPAGFATNVPHRNMEDEIARQLIDREVDVLLGGGGRHFDAASRKDGQDLFAHARQQNYQVLRTRDDLRKAQGGQGKLLGTFSKSHVPFYLDRQHDAELKRVTPSLEEMMSLALERLQDAPDGFLLQVEAGRIDHAAHNNDAVAILPEQLEFDRCIALARRFSEQHPDTLVVVTTDHGTAGFALNGYGPDYNLATDMFLSLGKAHHSLEYVAQHASADASTAQLVGQLEDALQLKAGPELRQAMQAAFSQWEHDEQLLGIALRDALYHVYAVNWTSENHTGEHVEFAAWGPGSDAIPGFYENWQLHHIIREQMGF